jgi:hypothetical protein
MKNVSMDYENLCKLAQKADPKIRFAGIINYRGKLIAGGMVTGKKALEDEKKDEMLFMELALRVKMRSEFNNDLGKVRFSMSLREKIIVMSFPIESDVMMVTMEVDSQFEKIALEILKLVEKL